MSRLWMRPQHGARSRRGRIGRAVLAAATLLLAGLVQAEEIPQDEPAGPAAYKLKLRQRAPVLREGAASRFERKLRPQVGFQLQSLSAISATGLPGANPVDHVLYSEMSDTVRRSAKRATRKALKNFLLETIDVSRQVDALESRVRGSTDRKRRVDFDVSVHRFLPEVSMQYGVGKGQMRLRLSAEGAVSVKYRSVGTKHTQISAGVNGDGRYEMFYGVAF